MRVLIFSADIGEGHELPARELKAGILAQDPQASVEIRDALACAGRLTGWLVRDRLEDVLRRRPWLFDAQYWLIVRCPPTRALAQRLGRVMAGRGLLRTVAELRPDVIVATYPGANDVLAAYRRNGRLAVPLVSAITDLAALRYWAHPGTDLHLVIHPESAAEIAEIAGPEAQVQAVRGLTAAAFERPPGRAQARRALALPEDRPIVVVSGGGWGVGDLEGAVWAALDARPDVVVLALCGRSAATAAQLSATFSSSGRVRVMPFTDRMAEVLAAADVLVHTTAGLTVLEALTCGTRVISYGWGIAHIRLNNRAYRRFGLTAVADDAAGLRAAVRRAIARPAQPDPGYAERPAAADLVIALGRRPAASGEAPA